MRIAVAQMPGAALAQWRATLALAESLIRRAADLGATLVVLPECAWPAYCLGSSAEYRRARAGGLPGPELFLACLQRVAPDRRIAVCTGYVAEQAGRLFNSACLIDADGRLLGTRSKCFLWDFDRDYFEPGNQIEPLDTPLGRIGIMICADARLPEIPATLAARGAQLILHPTAWVNAGTPERPWNPQPDFLIPTRAAELGVPIASASKWGRERDTTFVGSSLICAADGHLLAHCVMAETTVVTADVELAAPQRPSMTDSERAMLLSRTAPVLPRADVDTLRMLLVPPGSDERMLAANVPSTPGTPADLLALRFDAQTPDSVTRRAGHVLLTGPTASAVEIAGVRIHACRASEAATFATPRCLALAGAHVLVAFGDEVTLAQLKTRACENRVFVVDLTSENWCVIDPRGGLVAEGCWSNPESVTVEFDAAQAAAKSVAPHTDVIAGRCPEQYAF